MDAVTERLERLEQRLGALEAERQIRDLIKRYGCAVDACRGDLAAATFTNDGVYESDFGLISGQEQIATFIDSEARRERFGRTAHLVGPLLIALDPFLSRATVAGYSMVISAGHGAPSLDRTAINRWDVVKVDGVWRCARRTLRPVATPGAVELLHSMLTDDSFS